MPAGLHADTLRMPCAHCGAGFRSTVIDSRVWRGMVRRRRLCNACKYRWYTIEVPADLIESFPQVVGSLRAMRRDLDTVVSTLEQTAAWAESGDDDAA
jgi:transcriptional regulator NrdR family protein